MLQKLDIGTRRAYELDRESDALPTLDAFLKFLESRCAALENLSLPELPNISSNTRISKPKMSLTHHIHTFNNTNKPYVKKCIYCDAENHTIYSCFQFKNLMYQDKLKFIKTNNL